MKYNSELIKDIVETRGHEKSSIHYESECVETWIEENKGAYPKLCEYQSEWLNYINENPIGNFPYEIITDVTEATVNNVVPYAYKSAILKGSTKYRDIDTGEILETFVEGRNLELVSVKMPVLKVTGKNLFDGEIEIGTINADTGEPFDFQSRSRTVNFLNIKPNTSYSLKFFNDVYQCNRVFFYDSQKNYISNIIIEESEKIVTSPENARYIKLAFRKKDESDLEDNDLNNISNNAQLEQGTQATPYEPYKSNILTVNEDVTLRGIEDVQDTLDLMTGEVSQNLIEFEFNEGDYFGSAFTEFENTLRWQTTLSTRQLLKLKGSGKIYSTNFISDKSSNDFEHIRLDSSSPYANVIIYLSKTKASTYEELKTYLKNNPFTIVAEKAEKSIKTVDLSIQDQDGNTLIKIKPIEGTMHIHSDGTPLKPSITMEIPVEATTQNLASFIDLERVE